MFGHHSQNLRRKYFQRRDAPAAGSRRGAPLIPALQPFYRRRDAHLETFGGFMARGARLDGFDHAFRVARERLQILLEYDRKLGSQIELFAGLGEEILAVVSRYVVDPEKVQVTVDRRAKFSTLAVNIKIPDIL